MCSDRVSAIIFCAFIGILIGGTVDYGVNRYHENDNGYDGGVIICRVKDNNLYCRTRLKSFAYDKLKEAFESDYCKLAPRHPKSIFLYCDIEDSRVIERAHEFVHRKLPFSFSPGV